MLDLLARRRSYRAPSSSAVHRGRTAPSASRARHRTQRRYRRIAIYHGWTGQRGRAVHSSPAPGIAIPTHGGNERGASSPETQRGGVERDTYDRVRAILASTPSMTTRDAFARVAEETGRSVGTIQTSYYRIAREDPNTTVRSRPRSGTAKGAGRPRVATSTPATPANGRRARSRPPRAAISTGSRRTTSTHKRRCSPTSSDSTESARTSIASAICCVRTGRLALRRADFCGAHSGGTKPQRSATVWPMSGAPN